MTIISMNDLENGVEVEHLCAEAGGHIFVTEKGNVKLVVMDIDYYENTIGKVNNAKLVNEGLLDLENGDTVDGDSIRARMKEKYGV